MLFFRLVTHVTDRVYCYKSLGINLSDIVHELFILIFVHDVIVETGNGMKLLMTIAKPVPLPTVTWLGSIKKNTAIATMIVPTVIIANSSTVLRIFMECLSMITS